MIWLTVMAIDPDACSGTSTNNFQLILLLGCFYAYPVWQIGIIVIPGLAFLAPSRFGRRRWLGVLMTLAGLTGGPILLTLAIGGGYAYFTNTLQVIDGSRRCPDILQWLGLATPIVGTLGGAYGAWRLARRRSP